MKVFAVIASMAAVASAQVATVYPTPAYPGAYPGYPQMGYPQMGYPGYPQAGYPGMGYPGMGYPGMGYPGYNQAGYNGYRFARYDRFGRPVIDAPSMQAGVEPPAIWHVDAPVDGKAQTPTWEQPHYNSYWGAWLFNVDDADIPGYGYYPGQIQPGYPGMYPGMGYPGMGYPGMGYPQPYPQPVPYMG